MEDKVSVIVPIYKVERYLPKCIDSIINQTYKNLEIILVDDGSPDNCPSICYRYAKIDQRIKVIHKENGGLSDARNAGLRISTGEFLSFIDSDDWINPTMYEVLVKNALQYNAQISVGGVNVLLEEGQSYISLKSTFDESIQIECLNKIDSMKRFFTDNWSAWDKIYKRDVHIGVAFPKGIINEDEAVALQVLNNCNTVVYTNEALYNYIKRPNSITSSAFSGRKLDWYRNTVSNFEYINSNFPELKEYAEKRMLGAILWSLRCISSFDNAFSDEVKILVAALRTNKKPFLNNRLIRMKDKIWILILICSKFSVYKRLVKIPPKIATLLHASSY